MGWFSTNRKPFSPEFFEKLDELADGLRSLAESAVEDNSSGGVEIIPVEITGSRNVSGEIEYAWREYSTDDPAEAAGRSSEGYNANNAPDDYAFPAKRSPANRGTLIKHWVATEQDDGQGGTYPLHEIKHTLIGDAAGFWARINGNANYPCTAKWKYSWEQVEPIVGDSWQNGELSGTTSSGYALNTLEVANTQVLAYGIDVAPLVCGSACMNRYLIHDTNGDFEFKPVPDGAIVWMRLSPLPDGTVQAYFSAPNPIDGKCDNEDLDCP